MTKDEIKKALIAGEKFMTSGGLEADIDYFVNILIRDEFKIKPKTININGFEVPEPVMFELENNKKYWAVNLSYRLCIEATWNRDAIDKERLKYGVIHLTKEAAELHAKALLSFTAVKE